MLEMNEHFRARKKELAITFENMVNKLHVLRETVHKLKKKTHMLQGKAETVQSNAKSLAQRSASVLQSSNDLLPTITQSEYNYFQELKRLDTKTKVWDDELQKKRGRVLALHDSIKQNKLQREKQRTNRVKTPPRSSSKYGIRSTTRTTTPTPTKLRTPGSVTTPNTSSTVHGRDDNDDDESKLELSPHLMSNFKKLVGVTGQLLKKQSNRLKHADEEMEELAMIAGFDIGLDLQSV